MSDMWDRDIRTWSRAELDQARSRDLTALESLSIENEKLRRRMEANALDAAKVHADTLATEASPSKKDEVKISKEIFSKIEAERLERRAAEFNVMRGGDTVENLLKQLRDAGWRVASHSDYEIAEILMTRWIFIHRDGNGSYVKGEASTDLGALRLCAIKAESFAKGW